MSTAEKELDYLEWIAKVNEGLTLILLKMRDKTDISEENYELLRVLYKLYYNGDYMLFKTKGNLTDEKAVQQGLFAEEIKDSVHDDLAQ